jgi:oligopeptide/dipeptide ABC transporter ATP-binding protein
MHPDPRADKPERAPIISVANLGVAFGPPGAALAATSGITFEARLGETLALVGESGRGKSVTALALMGLPPQGARIDEPKHPYTQALLASAPIPEPGHARPIASGLQGDIPSPSNPPSGCRFRTRCLRADAVCADAEPPLSPRQDGRLVACHHV